MKKRRDFFEVLFIDFYDQNYTSLVKYLFLLVNDLDMAEDLAHDIFLRVYRSRSAKITSPKFKSYLKKAARNIAIDHLKKLAREEAKKDKIIPILMELDETFYSGLENSVIDGEVISTVRDVLEEFSEKNRKIFVSRVLERKTRRQICEEEEISYYVVKRVEDEIFHILRKKLKQYLK